MAKIYQKGAPVSLGAHFTSVNFDCHCKRQECSITLVDERLPPALDLLWDKVGPFKIDSGFRCKAHNAEVGGEKGSKHLDGQAADCKSLEKKPGKEIAAAAETIPDFKAGGIGTYPTFAHCDVREDGPARWRGGTKLSLIAAC
jgi:uncharacterized protein YcbK (DUF882 family)